MAYNEDLANRVRGRLAEQVLPVVEKKLFQGFGFMVDDKLCIWVKDEALMCRVGPDRVDEVLEKKSCSQMLNGGRVMKGYVLVEAEGYRKAADFEYWITLCLDYNKIAKVAKKRK